MSSNHLPRLLITAARPSFGGDGRLFFYSLDHSYNIILHYTMPEIFICRLSQFYILFFLYEKGPYFDNLRAYLISYNIMLELEGKVLKLFFYFLHF